MATRSGDFTRTELRAGLFVIASAAALVLFVAAIAGYRPQASTKTFYANFTDTAGLNRGAEVRFGGFLVGRVTNIGPDADDKSLIRATAEVSKNTPVNAGSEASITQIALTSAKHLEISTGLPEEALLEAGATLPSRAGGLFDELGSLTGGLTDLLDDIKLLLGAEDKDGRPTMTDDERKTLAELMVTMDGLGKDVQVMVGVHDSAGNETQTDEERTTLAKLLDSADTTLENADGFVTEVRVVLDENKQPLNDLMDNFNKLSTDANDLVGDVDSFIEDNRPNIDGALEDLRGLMDKLGTTVDDVAGRFEGMADSLEATLKNAENLTGDTAYLLDRNIPELEDMVMDLRATVRNLKEFTRTLSEEPQAIIRGKSPQGRN